MNTKCAWFSKARCIARREGRNAGRCDSRSAGHRLRDAREWAGREYGLREYAAFEREAGEVNRSRTYRVSGARKCIQRCLMFVGRVMRTWLFPGGEGRMTRCMNCGAEMSDERCDVCGLTPTAAEFSVRSKLLNRTAVFLLGAVAFVVAGRALSGARARRHSDFHRRGFLRYARHRDLAGAAHRAHQDVDVLKRLYYGLIPLPWLLALLLIANGAFDTSRLRGARAGNQQVFDAGPDSESALIVTSWRDGHRLERISVDRVDFDRFTKGDLVNVKVHEGLASIPWVSGVSMQ